MSGRIVILNGAPRSGKSTIARAMQAAEPTWLNLGVDAVKATTPEQWQPGIGLRPGGERPDLEPIVLDLYRGLFESLRALSRNGIDVVSDLGIHDGYSRSLGILEEAVQRLSDLPVLFVGVRCDRDEIMRRRGGEPGYSSDPRMAARWDDAVHRPGVYDLSVDTGERSPEDCADAIAELLDEPPARPAFARLAGYQRGRAAGTR
jgi:chloramphenicol 3-O phosphotransferase